MAVGKPCLTRQPQRQTGEDRERREATTLAILCLVEGTIVLAIAAIAIAIGP